MVTELILPRGKILDPKPKSYVKLDMAFGVGAGTSLFDKSRYRSHGAISGADWATGAHGKCLDFVPTVPDYVEIPAAHTQLDFTSEDFSIVARVNVDDLTADRHLFCRGRWKNSGYRLKVTAAGILSLETNQATANQTTNSAAAEITTGAWLTLGFSRSGAVVTLYKNGVDITSVSGTHVNPLTSPYNAYIGIYYDETTEPFDGKIEFLRIFGGIALPASTHLAYHNALA